MSGASAGSANSSLFARRAIVLGAGALAGSFALGALGVMGTAKRFATEARDTPGPDDVLTFFDTIALTRRDADGGEYAGWVRKWTGPVSVRIRGNPDAGQRADLWSIVGRLARWSGLEFRVARDATGHGNTIDVHFLEHAEMTARYGAGGPVCHCRTLGNNGALHTGTMEVDTLYSDCLRHEFMHALGCDNHWTGPRATAAMPSVLALRYGAARSPRFTECDELAIRALYDPRMAPRTPREQALPIARQIIRETMTA
jgi:hypothetical protein